MGLFDWLATGAGAAGGFLLGGPAGAMAGAQLGSGLAGARSAGKDSATARRLQEEQISEARRQREEAMEDYRGRAPLRDTFMSRLMGFRGAPGNPFSDQVFGGAPAAPAGGGGGFSDILRSIAGKFPGRAPVPATAMPPAFNPAAADPRMMGNVPLRRIDPRDPLTNYSVGYSPTTDVPNRIRARLGIGG